LFSPRVSPPDLRHEAALNPGVVAAIATIGIFCLTLGLSYPLLSLILDSMGISTGLIGLNAAMTPLGIIVSSPFIPSLARRFGAWFLCVVSFCVVAIVLVLLAVIKDVGIWFALRFILGVANTVIFITSEVWINQLAPSRIRGRIIGIYTTVAAAGFAMGPLVIAAIGSQGWLPFAVAVVGVLLALPFVVSAKSHLPDFNGTERASVLSFFLTAPLMLLAVSLAALFDQAMISLLPLYILRHGILETTASLMLAVLIVGNVLLQIPIGWLADRMPRGQLLGWLAFGTVLGSLLLSWLIQGALLIWPMLFVWGAVAFGTYTVAMVELGHRFSGGHLLAGNSVFGLMWGLGGIVGPSVAGTAMDLFGPKGLPVTLGVLFGMLGLAAMVLPLSRAEAHGAH